MATVSATTVFALVAMATIVRVQGIYLQGSGRSYAKYEKWNGCKNASVSFEFKSSQNSARLMYVDDGGQYDFIDVSYSAGRVRLDINIVDGQKGTVRLEAGRNVNDGRWHKVEVIRNRMETKLVVDGQQDSDYSFGSDFNFGNIGKNSYVFFGGLPDNYDVTSVSNPSALYASDRLRGFIRNVIYRNCSCIPVRAALLDGYDMDQYPPEPCDRSNPCQRDCVCVSEDNSPKCDCANQECASDAVVHYSLPFDAMDGSTCVNPSGLDATAYGNPSLVPGVLNTAIRLETPRQYVRVTGPGHRYECFGDLNKCSRGHTLSFWVNFENPVQGEVVYLSNGGHTDQSHGVAMMYDNGQLEFRYRRKNGAEWSAKTEGVKAGKWYHIATSWSSNDGLSLYINGEFKDRDISPSVRSPESVTEDYSSFFIGKKNDDTSSNPPAFSNKTILVDEFNFWSTYMTADQIRELGPFAHFHLPMDLSRGNKFIDTTWTNTIQGRPNLVPARINDGMKCDGRGDHVDLMNQRNTCMGDIAKCQHGTYTGMWAKFDQIHDNMYVLDSGNKGFRWYIQNGKLYCEYQRGNQNWRASFGDVKANQWYYLESSFKADDGVRLWRNLQQVAHEGQSTYKTPLEGGSNMYVGRANTNMIRERYFEGTADELEVWYADRQTLIDMGYIQRGRPFMYYFDMESIVGNQLINPQISVMVNGQRRTETVEGQVGNALRLDGRWSQYAQLGQHNDTCLGNLNQCRHGALLAGWVRLSDIRDGSHIFYTGQNGIKVRYNNGRIESSASTGDKEWSVSHGNMDRDKWHYVEYAWHPTRGFKVYVDQQLMGEDLNPKDRPTVVYNGENNGVYFGRGGDIREGTADTSMDEIEYWYSNREYLVAFDFLQRGKPEHLLIDMDRISNDRVVHPYITARVYGNAQVTRGRIDNAVRLDGRSQYIDIGDQSDSCLGDMKKCRHGYTGSMYLNVKDFRDNDYYLSTGTGMNIYYKNDRVNFVVYDPETQRRWLVEVPGLGRDQWYNLQYTWHKDRGLRVYLDNKLVGRSNGEPFYNFPRGRSDVLIGRANPNAVPYGHNNYANVEVDNFEVWYLDRDDLINRGIIQTPDDIEHFYIPLEVQMGNVVAHPRLRILLYDGASIVPAYINNGATMDGTRQFVSLGEHKTCMGDLDECKNGLTYTFHVNARKLDDRTYLMSAGPYSVYYHSGRLHAEMATSDEKWTTSGPGIQTNKWYRVDVTWSKEKGLELFVNDRMVGRDTNSQRTRTEINDYNVYLGRPNGRTRGRHLDGRIDEVEYWFAHRDTLIDLGVWNPVVPTEPPTTPAPSTTTRGTPRTTPVPTTPAMPSLVFDSNNWVLYDWSQLPEDYFSKNDREQITLKFRSRDPNGLIWLSGTRERNMHVSLKNGALLVVADHGDDNSDKYRVRPPSGRLDDNEWHTAVIRRDGRRLTITIDGRSFDQVLTQEPMIIGLGAMTLGGTDNVSELTDSHVRARLNGEVREAVISGNNLRSDIDLTDLFFRTPRPGYVIINGPFPHFGPKETSIHIREPSSFVKLPDLGWEPRQGGKIEFKFRTAQQHGLLLYNGGRPGLRDFIAVEMHDGKLYFNVDMGPGVNRYKFSDDPVNDGKPHEVKVEKSGNIFRLTLDGAATQHVVPGSDQSLSLGGDLYLGGASREVAPYLPWHLWTRVPRTWTMEPKFYVGCIWDFKLNDGNLYLDLPKMVKDQRMPGIDAGCVAPDMQCDLNPCAHGVCRSTATGFICDCAGTPYTGDRCEKRAPIVTFDGTDFLRINLQPTMETHTNDISVRFKTHKPNGLIFVTSNRNNGGKMVVDLNRGRARVQTNLGGEEKEVFAGNDLNDERWHTLYIQRRADHLEVWVDDQPRQKIDLPGEGWTLDIDEILMAANGKDAPPDDTYVGYMQNFFFNDHRYFEMVDPNEVGPGVIISDRERPIPIFPVTFVSPTDSHLTLPSLVVADGFEVSFLVKTKEKDGLLLYNDGLGNEFLALEMIGGYVQLIFDDGTGPKLLRGIPNISNDQWHRVTLRRPPGENFELVVDEISTKLPPNVRKDRMQLHGDLYVGGLPRNRYDNLPEQIMSRHGYRGCMASMRIQRKLVDMFTDSLTKTEYLKKGCTTVTAFCRPNTCAHDGICREGWNDFICDCNMTSFVGRTCTEEAEGYHYEDWGRGIVMYNFPPPHPSPSQDELAFAFMSWFPNGTLFRVDSDDSNDFIDISLQNGYVVATYDIGEGTFRMMENRRNFSDGQYHIVRFIRKGHDATLRVNDYPMHRNNPEGTSVRLFNGQSVIKIAGNRAVNGSLYDNFNGILAGVYFNGIRIIDRGIIQDGNIYQEGDYYIAKHPFFLPPPGIPPTKPPTVKPGGPTNGPIITHKPGETTGGGPTPSKPPPKPGGVEVPHHVPYGQGGGGVAFQEFGPGGEGIFVAVDPGGAGGGLPAPGGGVSLPVVSQVGAAGGVEGGRAIAATGAMLGILLFGSSLVWAFYKLKPGVMAGGGGGKGMSISRPTTNYKLVSNNGPPYASMNKTEANGGVAVEAYSDAANASTQTSAEMAALANYFSSSAITASSISNTAMAAPGFMMRAAQTDMAAGGFAGAPLPPATVAAFKSSSETQTQDLVDLNAAAQALVQHQEHQQNQQLQQNQQTQQQLQNQQLQQQQLQQQQSYNEAYSQQFSSYQMSQQMYQNQMQNQAQSQTGYSQNLMAAEEIRVDCALMTGDSRYVITGSINGPPQVWDMKSGNLVRIMGGENLSSTDVHLACNDTLMVGQVAEMAQVDPTDTLGASRVQNRKLQLWDISSGQPLEMAQSELCTASCMMKDGERIVLGRTEKFGGGTTVVIWDLLANEPVRKIHYDGAVGFADHISYISLSDDNRYVIAGFQNSYDGNANFIIFDLTVSDYSRVEPKIIALDAQAECTAILPNHEAVTGTRQGELVIWSMRTGKPLRQLVATGNKAMSLSRGGNMALACAHTAEVKGVAVSNDEKILVSAGADCTVKVWNLETEKLMHTLRGHTDQVLSCSVSADSEIVVSGSKDGTIRLWKAFDGSPITQFYTGIDIFKVIMSKNKHYIVGLGDREGARKLVMLQVVRTKTRSRAPSRATSPYGTSSRPTSPYARSTSPYGTSPHHRPISPYR